MSPVNEKKRCLRVTRETTNEDGSHEITINGEKDAVVQLAGALQYGVKWIRMLASGEIETSDVYMRPPAPTDDPQMQNIWQFDPLPKDIPVQLTLRYDDPEMRDPKNEWSKHNREIFLQSIQGYAGQEAYIARAKRLAEAGFTCLRSRRGDDGKYWEMWYLPYPCGGRGPIKDMKTSDEIKKWVFKNISPGNVTMGGEHWGLSAD